MASPENAVQIEDVYRRLSDGKWLEALTALTRLGDDLANEKHIRRACEVFLDEFFRSDTDPGPEESSVLEKLMLLDNSGRIELSEERREKIVLRLVRMHESEPELAASFARFLPDHPDCREILESSGPAPRDRQTAAGAPISVEEVGRRSDAGGARSLFRSATEQRFYDAVVRVFPTYLIVPNAALHAVVDFDAIRDDLTPRECDYFFKALLDIVVIDQAKSYFPAYVLEIDSHFHDDEVRKERDEMKNRILSLAGIRTYRVRPNDSRESSDRFASVLRRIIQQD